jgi:hypothetical protein
MRRDNAQGLDTLTLFRRWLCPKLGEERVAQMTEQQLISVEQTVPQHYDLGREMAQVIRHCNAEPVPHLLIDRERQAVSPGRLLGQQLGAEMLAIAEALNQATRLTLASCTLNQALERL